MKLTHDEINLLFLALNDREGVLACDYEKAHSANPGGAAEQDARAGLKAVRDLSARLEVEWANVSRPVAP